eukprot:47905_1
MSGKWTQLPKSPKERFSNIILLGNDEFIISPYNYSKQKSDGLIKYNCKSNKWSSTVKYPKSFEINNSALSLDTSSNTLYLLGAQSIISCIDLNKSSFTTNIGSLETGVNPSSLFVDGKLHILGGSRNRKHLLRDLHHIDNDDDNKEKFNEIFEFTDWTKGNQNC